ncbi:hypothetical protein B0H67DRAFT_645873 [Lasiosphaeris hirsuta]|uniref:C2H2-type domain-containing protein n=1 Tax=Lasiosphaeris hirsuta TaxID=260670 RepID=A0AA40AI42_9PEZI|nr:hypothetical protein B0H67DRAFT_645873 [Lasiosphaeris hirsuta]
MSSAQSLKGQPTHQLFLERCRTKYSWASGATRGTPSAIERHRRDLEVAFSEINGLMAGMHYQDQAEDSPASPPISLSPSPLQETRGRLDYPAEIDITDDLLGDPPGPSHTAAPEPPAAMGDQPMASQWAAIRSLRKETEFHHARFQALVTQLRDPIISNLLKIHPDARSIRNTGAQMVKDILEGFQPRELSLVFAFTSFSYSISQLLYKKDRIGKSDILADIRAWRDLIADPKERHAFNRLAPELWPEAKEYLHFIDIPAYPAGSAVPLPNPWPETVPLVGSAALSPFQLLHPQPDRQPETTPPVDYTAPSHPQDRYSFDNMPMDPNPGDARLSQDIVDMMNISQRVFGFSSIDPDLIFSNQSQWPLANELQPPDPPVGLPAPPMKFDPPDREEKSSPLTNQAVGNAKLEETVMFLVILAFLQETGQLLYILSGRSLASRCYKMYPAQKREQEAFYRKAQEVFFKPWSQRPNSGAPAFRALVSVAEMFTQGGYLRSIDEIEHYLACVATAVLPPGAAFKEFISSIFSEIPATSTQTPDSSNPKKRRRKKDDDPAKASKQVPQRRLCKYDGCNATYSDPSGLRKHCVQSHGKPGPLSVSCGECNYTSLRRDRVRDHFRKQHSGIALPENLQDKKRSVQGV